MKDKVYRVRLRNNNNDTFNIFDVLLTKSVDVLRLVQSMPFKSQIKFGINELTLGQIESIPYIESNLVKDGQPLTFIIQCRYVFDCLTDDQIDLLKTMV